MPYLNTSFFIKKISIEMLKYNNFNIQFITTILLCKLMSLYLKNYNLVILYN